MVKYNTSGTLGDVLIVLCKIYNTASTDNVKVFHKTKHKNLYGLIKTLYSLLPKTIVEFVDDFYDGSLIRLHGEFISDFVSPAKNPNFNDITDISKFNLPENYMVISPKSGTHQNNREIMKQKLDSYVYSSKEKGKNIVLIGKDYEYNNKDNHVINLIDKTTLKEALEVVGNSNELIGFQGLMCWFGLSQKIPTTIHWQTMDDLVAIRARTKHWKEYLKGVVK